MVYVWWLNSHSAPSARCPLYPGSLVSSRDSEPQFHRINHLFRHPGVLFAEFLKEYREEFVAVWNQMVIGADTDLKRLSKEVKEKTRSAKGVYIGYVSDKPVEMIV